MEENVAASMIQRQRMRTYQRERHRCQTGVATLVHMRVPWMHWVDVLRAIEHVMVLVPMTFVLLSHAAFASAKVLLRMRILRCSWKHRCSTWDAMRVEGWAAGHHQSTVIQNALQRAMSVALVSHTQDAAAVA